MTREKINQALCVILVAGQEKEAIDGEVYASLLSSGADLEIYELAKGIARKNGLIEQTGTFTFRNTVSGNNMATEIRQAMGL